MWGVSLTHPELASFLLWEFLLHILIWLHFYAGSFSYTSRAVFFFLFFLSGEFLLHIPCWFHFFVGSFSYTFHDCFIFLWEVSLTLPMLASFFMRGVSHTHPVIALFFCGKFLLHFPCWLHFYAGSLSYTSRAVYSFMQGVSVTHSLLFFFFFFFFAFFFKSGEFLLLIPSWFYLLSAEFLLHTSCWLHFCFGSFSYTSRGGFICIWVVSLTHPAQSSFLYGEFLLYNPSFCVRSFSYTSRAGFIFIWGVSLTHPMVCGFVVVLFFVFLSVEFLLHAGLFYFILF